MESDCQVLERRVSAQPMKCDTEHVVRSKWGRAVVVIADGTVTLYELLPALLIQPLHLLHAEAGLNQQSLFVLAPFCPWPLTGVCQQSVRRRRRNMSSPLWRERDQTQLQGWAESDSFLPPQLQRAHSLCLPPSPHGSQRPV